MMSRLRTAYLPFFVIIALMTAVGRPTAAASEGEGVVPEPRRVFRNTGSRKSTLTPNSAYRRRKESSYFHSRRWIRLRGRGMLWRTMVALSMLTALGQTATAGERPSLAHRVSCTVVRYYVARYSEWAAEAWARSHGATDAEIQTARSCLSGSSVQTANLQK
jgi:hypothetical protein